MDLDERLFLVEDEERKEPIAQIISQDARLVVQIFSASGSRTSRTFRTLQSSFGRRIVLSTRGLGY